MFAELGFGAVPCPMNGGDSFRGFSQVVLVKAETLIRLGIDKLVTGSVGPNARPLLEAAGMVVVTGQSGKISAHLPAAGGPPETGDSRTTVSMRSSKKVLGTDTGRKPAGYCFCRHCGHQTDDDSGLPCFKLKCPACGATMERRFN